MDQPITNLTDVQSTIMLDPRQAMLYAEDKYVIKKSCSSYVTQKFTPVSISPSQVNFTTINPPGKQTVVSRNSFYVDLQVTYNFTGDATAGTGYLLPTDPRYPAVNGIGVFDSSWMCLRPLAINHCMGSSNFTINGQSMSSTTNQYISAVPYLFDDAILNTTPVCQPDVWPQIPQNQYNANSPMSPYGTSMYKTNRADATYTILENGPTSAKLRVEWREPLIFPGLLNFINENHSKGFVGVGNFNIQLVFKPLSNAMEIASYGVPSYDQPSGSPVDVTYPTIVESLTSFDRCDLRIQWINPTAAFPPISLPQKYNFNNWVPNITEAGTKNPGDDFTVVSQNYIWPTVPKMLAIWVGKSQMSGTDSSGNVLPITAFSDTFAIIKQLNVQYGTYGDLFNSYSPFDLYTMAVKNGSKQSFRQFTNEQGSLILLSFGDDILSQPLSGVATQENTSIIVTVQCKDNNPAAIIVNPSGSSVNYTNNTKTNWALYVVPIFENILSIGEFSTILTQSYDPSAILQDLQAGNIDISILDVDSYANNAIGGAGWWSRFSSGLRNVVSKVGDWIKSNPNLTKNIIKGVGTAVGALAPEFAPEIALGVSGLDTLVDKYTGKGYSPQQIHAMLGSQFPARSIEQSLLRPIGGRMLHKSRLQKRRY